MKITQSALEEIWRTVPLNVRMARWVLDHASEYDIRGDRFVCVGCGAAGPCKSHCEYAKLVADIGRAMHLVPDADEDDYCGAV